MQRWGGCLGRADKGCLRRLKVTHPHPPWGGGGHVDINRLISRVISDSKQQR